MQKSALRDKNFEFIKGETRLFHTRPGVNMVREGPSGTRVTTATEDDKTFCVMPDTVEGVAVLDTGE